MTTSFLVTPLYKSSNECGTIVGMHSESSQRASVWTRYWSQGAESSCAGSYEGAYGKAIVDFWSKRFLLLKPNARVLDIGTGNGPVPRILMDIKSRPDLSCDAVDLANVAPLWMSKLPASMQSRARFHSNCQAESLPFAPASFDLVVSQWGLEYSNLDISTSEVLRVLKPDGVIQLLLHHVDALPVTLAAEEIAHLEWILTTSPILDSARKMLRPMVLAGSAEGRLKLVQDPIANDIRGEFNAQLEVLQHRIQQGQCVDVLFEARDALMQILAIAATDGLAEGEKALQLFRQTLTDSLLRLQELRKHALNTKSAQALAAKLSRSGTYQLEELRDQDRLMAWALVIGTANKKGP